MNVTTSTLPPDKDNDKPGYAIARVSDVEKSFSHVNQLLSIANHASQLLVRPDNFDERVEFDPSAVKTARETYELAHIKLRDLIDENGRWDMVPGPAEQKTTDILAATEKLYDQKTINAKILNRPSVFLNARIARFDVGWIAWVGDGVPNKSSLHAIGESPAVAMKNFDEVYYDVQQASKASVVPPEATAPKPRKKK